MVEETFKLSDIKVLDSKARVEILRLLSRRRATISELSRTLGMSKSTVQYHILKLNERGFVIRKEDKRKWVYYELSEKGHRVLRYRKLNVALLLTSSLFAVLAGVVQIWRHAALKPGVKGVHPESYLLYSGVVFIAISLILLAAASALWWKQRHEL